MLIANRKPSIPPANKVGAKKAAYECKHYPGVIACGIKNTFVCQNVFPAVEQVSNRVIALAIKSGKQKYKDR